MIKPQRTVAKRFHLVHGVRTKQHGGALRFELHDALKRLFGKRAIAHAQCFVNDQNIGVGAGGNRESQAHIHAAGIGFNGLVNELTYARKLNNAFVQRIGFCARKTHYRGRQIHIFTAREFGVETRTQFQQGTNLAIHSHAAATRVEGAADHLQQSRFASAIATNQAQGFAAAHLQIERRQGHKFIGFSRTGLTSRSKCTGPHCLPKSI